MSDDGTMYGWTRKALEDKAREDNERGEYNRVPGWLGPLSEHTTAGSIYHKAWHDDD
jgi:hypothetical protein